jgi:dTDP-4-dehydrorhamnose reductase
LPPQSLPEQIRILLTGTSGQVGGDLLPLLQPFGSVLAPTRSDLDLGDARGIRDFIRRIKPDWIINPAAYTAVDKAESEPELAFAINAEAPRVIGDTAAELGIPVIHFSTDYVYNGAGASPWLESDEPGPLGVYGASKLAGERALASSGAAHLIFRTSWVYSSRGKNFLLTILRLAQEREELRIVGDQHGAPTWSRDLARMVVHVINTIFGLAATRRTSVEQAVRAVQGVYNAADSGEITWIGFAREVLHLFGAAFPEAKLARLVPIPSTEYPTPAKRPANSRLDCSRLKNVFGFIMPDWQQSVSAVMAEVMTRESPAVFKR